MNKGRKTIAIPPGATIKEQLEDRGMTQKEFAKRMDMSEKHISQLINGKTQLTYDMAIRLEIVLGIPADFWNKLEANYRDKLVRVEAEEAEAAEIEMANKMPYKEMVRLGWLEAAKTAKEKVMKLRRFFEVARLGAVEKLMMPGIAYRCLAREKTNQHVLAAVVQKARLEARNIETQPKDLAKLRDSIGEIRSMTRDDPSVFYPKLKKLLAECGIAIVVLPLVKGSFLHGASFYDGKKIVTVVTVRQKYADIFWFSLFHEIGHILDDNIQDMEEISSEEEEREDAFSRDTLIPAPQYKLFTSKKDFSRHSVMEFARAVQIDNGIVVGRLQKDRYIEFSWYNDLRIQYCVNG